MGCDYYIFKILKIYYSKNDFLEIELGKIRGYYDDSESGWDEDANSDDDDETFKNYLKYILTPKMKPITIYDSNGFCKSSFESKYKIHVENEIIKNGKKWSDITKIIKVETRSN
jgi:hypothetical protein